MTKDAMQAVQDWRQGRGYVHSFVCDYIASMQSSDRSIIIEALEEAGLHVVQQTAVDVTVSNPDTGNQFTLRGPVYRHC